jgi:hypothetical protein
MRNGMVVEHHFNLLTKTGEFELRIVIRPGGFHPKKSYQSGHHEDRKETNDYIPEQTHTGELKNEVGWYLS